MSKVSEVKESYIAIVGENNSIVEEIQQKLYDLGYTSQLVTGYYGDITFNNVAYFQIVNNLTVTGWIDDATYDKLFTVDETSIPEVVELNELEWEEVENQDGWKEYLYSSGKQFVFGNFTKKEAYKLGWILDEANLADVAPGKSIGGDIFYNDKKLLPEATGRMWYEVDINYTSVYRGNDRLLYSNDGLFYKTTNHYESFEKIGD